MQLYEMSLEEAIKGLQYYEGKHQSILYCNDDARTTLVKSITRGTYEALLNFDLSKLEMPFYICESQEEYEAGEIIEKYIVPKLEKAKDYYKTYEF